MKLLLLDNYDSFTWNLAQYFGELGAEVTVLRNDAIDLAGVRALQPARIVISPGPCAPAQAGVSLALIRHFAGVVPILGVCLGHQAIGEAFGGEVVRARQVVHGKASAIRHDGRGLFAGMAQNVAAARYHSLAVARASLPDCLEVSAQTEDGEIMGLRHRSLAVEGVQFHPESVLTEAGHQLLANFLATPSPAGGEIAVQK
jgi:anthranilate synthase component 2